MVWIIFVFVKDLGFFSFNIIIWPDTETRAVKARYQIVILRKFIMLIMTVTRREDKQKNTI